EGVGCSAGFLLLGAEEIDEEEWILLGASVVVGADVIEVGAIGERVLGNQVDVAAVEVRVPLFGRRQLALAKDHVGRIEPAGISASKQNGIRGHRRINLEWRLEHVVTKPKAEQMAALFIIRPMREDGMDWHHSENPEEYREWCLFPMSPDCSDGYKRQTKSEQGVVFIHRKLAFQVHQ